MMTFKNTTIHNGLCLTACILLSLCSLSQDKTWKTFTDTAGHFSARYPEDWKNKIKESNRVFFTSPADSPSDNFFENVNIHVLKNPAFGTEVKITDVCPSIIEQLKPAYTEFTSESQRFFKWNNMEACELVFTGFNKIDESIKVRMTQWFCFYKQRLYTVTYTAAASNTFYTETARKIMGSIVFK